MLAIFGRLTARELLKTLNLPGGPTGYRILHSATCRRLLHPRDGHHDPSEMQAPCSRSTLSTSARNESLSIQQTVCMIEPPPSEFRSAVGSRWKTVDSDPVPHDTRIVRYMKWSAFLTLLCGRVFLPNMRKLEAIDAHENRLPSHPFGKFYGYHLSRLLEPHEEWLCGKAEG
jgi:hypothetical protein